MSSHEILEKMIQFADEELLSYIEKKDSLQDTLSIVLTSLFRKIIEHTDGIYVLAENGASGSSETVYRTLLESYMGFQYILEKEEFSKDRAIAYTISYHKHQIEAAKIGLSMDMIDQKGYEQATKKHKEALAKAEFSQVLKHYNKLQRKAYQNYIPKWHSLYNGPKSIKQLAQYLETEDKDKNKDLVQNLYSFISSGAHAYLSLKDFVPDPNGKIHMKPIRSNEFFLDKKNNQNDFISSVTLLSSAIMGFSRRIYPEYLKQAEDLMRESIHHTYD